jgi:SAM-dependent methyltransferase
MRTNSSDNASTGQVSTAAAEVYEEFFVPALFGQWAAPMLDAVDAHLGDCVIDIGTGTGVLARAALRRVGSTGSVIAVDPNDGMLAVAARLAPEFDVRRGVAEQLPVADNETTCTTCQFALMFFQDRARAISEMARVTRPGGRVAVATWAAIEESPGYAAMVDLLGEVLGGWAAEALRAPFCIGTTDELKDLCKRRSVMWWYNAERATRVSRRSTSGCTPTSGAGRCPTTSTTSSSSDCVGRPPKGWRDSSAPTAW